MTFRSVKSLLAAGFSVFFMFCCFSIFAQVQKPETESSTKKEEKKGFDANEVIFGHVLDAHEFHFLSYESSDGTEHEAAIPLPVFLYSPQKGFSAFMFSRFHHGEENYKGYELLSTKKIEEQGLDDATYNNGQIVALNDNGQIDNSVQVYDLSPTRNVVQMIIALALLVWGMISIAKRYKSGQGITTAPKGAQSLFEPVIIFIVDEVAKPNLGKRYQKYLPYLLTVFFFILINTLVGLIPGTANVTGNIAFTFILAFISFIYIMFSTNKHYWAHIINPPVPVGIKPILIIVEILGIFTKPFALCIRLFANMIAGHIIIICLVSLIFIFGAISTGIGWGFSPLSVAFVIFIYFIELLVAFLQAYIFAYLTAVFIGQAFEGGHDDVDHFEDIAIV
ncbi:MAG: F0F1 ATP synthase subunit A [Parafilimonas sp.]